VRLGLPLDPSELVRTVEETEVSSIPQNSVEKNNRLTLSEGRRIVVLGVRGLAGKACWSPASIVLQRRLTIRDRQ
jgi:hypothetical protein